MSDNTTKMMVSLTELDSYAKDIQNICKDMNTTEKNLRVSGESLIETWIGPSRATFLETSDYVNKRILTTCDKWDGCRDILEQVCADRSDIDTKSADAASVQ